MNCSFQILSNSANLGAQKGYLLGNRFWVNPYANLGAQKGYLLGNRFGYRWRQIDVHFSNFIQHNKK